MPVRPLSQKPSFALLELTPSTLARIPALPHYQPSPARPTPISLSSPYLNDSGAQYLDGTIDTTRTMHFGRPTREQMRAFTRVLQGHIAVDVAVFPEGSTGDQLDTLARAPLWRDGMN